MIYFMYLWSFYIFQKYFSLFWGFIYYVIDQAFVNFTEIRNAAVYLDEWLHMFVLWWVMLLLLIFTMVALAKPIYDYV